MLRFAMLSLSCAVSFGVFGYGGGAPHTWNASLDLCITFMALSMLAFLGATLPGPATRDPARDYNHSSAEKSPRDSRDARLPNYSRADISRE